MVPLPVPEGVTVHHVSLLTAVQLEFEVTVKLVLPATEPTFWFEGVTESVGGGGVVADTFTSSRHTP
jgi:hypothetical protein